MKFDNLILIVIFLGVVSFVGILAGMIYFSMNIVDTSLHTINFTIPVGANMTLNENLTTGQDILDIVVYPILELRNTVPYLTYFLVFAFIIALGMSAYVSSKNPIFFVVHLLFTLLMTYFCIILSNNYVSLMTNTFINSMMINFTIYNTLMFYLPQIVFFTSMIFGVIAFVNVIKPQSASTTGTLQYGGDY